MEVPSRYKGMSRCATRKSKGHPANGGIRWTDFAVLELKNEASLHAYSIPTNVELTSRLGPNEGQHHPAGAELARADLLRTTCQQWHHNSAFPFGWGDALSHAPPLAACIGANPRHVAYASSSPRPRMRPGRGDDNKDVPRPTTQLHKIKRGKRDKACWTKCLYGRTSHTRRQHPTAQPGAHTHPKEPTWLSARLPPSRRTTT